MPEEILIRAAPPRVWEVLVRELGPATSARPYVEYVAGVTFRLRVKPKGTLLTADGPAPLEKIKTLAEQAGFPSAGMVGSEGGATS